MAKKAQTIETVPGSNPALDLLMASAKSHFGGSIFTGREQDRQTWVFPVPSLGLQWLIDCNGIPSGFISLAGPPKTYKSSALLEFCDWFLQPPIDSAATIVHTEGKYSGSKTVSMLGERAERLGVKPATAVDGPDGWQTHISMYLKKLWEFREEMLAGKLPDGAYLPPLCLGADSVTGAQTEEMSERVLKEGAGVGRSFQDRAGVITSWMNVWASRLPHIPALVVLVGHLKQKMETSGPPGRGPSNYVTGGVGLGFHTSLDIWVKKIKELDKVSEQGALLQWRTHYNSLGRDNRTLEIPYIEGYDANGQQTAYFDWNAATTRKLVELQSVGTYAGIKDITHIVAQDAAGGPYYSCKQLSISPDRAKADKITASKMGEMIHADPNIVQQLQKALLIQVKTLWSPAMVYAA